MYSARQGSPHGVPRVFVTPRSSGGMHVAAFYREPRPGLGCMDDAFPGPFFVAAGPRPNPPQASAAAIKARGAFTVALSGGSLVKSLAPLVERPDVDFARWHVLFADERNVAHDSPDSNLLAAREGLLSKIPVPAEQVLAIREGVSAQLAATHYAGLLLDLGPSVLPVTDDGQPRIDLVLLGERCMHVRGRPGPQGIRLNSGAGGTGPPSNMG